MSWITFDNLKRFWKGIRTNPVTFTGEIDLQNTTRYKGKEIATKADVSSGGSNIEVDVELSDTSTNPVQNRVVTAVLNEKVIKNWSNFKIAQDREGLWLSGASTNYPAVNVTSDSFIVTAAPGDDHDERQLGIIAVGGVPGILYRTSNKTIAIVFDEGTEKANIMVNQDTISPIATEDFVKANYVPLSNGHISINGSELWVE